MSDDKKQPLNCDRDPKRWAEEFNRALYVQGQEPLDEGFLIGWFANAMMCGEDTYRWRTEKSTPSAEQPINAATAAGAETPDGQKDCARRPAELAPAGAASRCAQSATGDTKCK